MLSSMPASDPDWVDKIGNSPNAQKFREGRSNFGDLGVKIPEDYQTYLDMGRFRNALVLAEQKARPTRQLEEFIFRYQLYATQGE
jgi:hypothetical protein